MICHEELGSSNLRTRRACAMPLSCDAFGNNRSTASFLKKIITNFLRRYLRGLGHNFP